MDYKEKTRTEESNSAELNSAEENATVRASVEEQEMDFPFVWGIYLLPLPLAW